ncbi:ATPase [Desulfoluna limicola]|uniref:ATPase n=1 Tax=Desulfoluna limicola TaxID=2810562 RepID=A0ABN6F172_9BACT|nr:MoxR family ATPase [Desulfoluna limicola]BCS95355.1 ATPase [Desulfoluna limicola]
MTPRDDILELKALMSRSVLGQEAIVDRLLLGLLANGHLLVEGLPGLAKTRAVKSLAANLETGMNRIQFVPDLLPSDVTGTEVYHNADGRGEFQFQAGPIFNNIILADEINRAPAKVQAALLEAMEERQVTVAGTTHKLPELFMVMATQNPIEQEGTYPLPEAQMDRFLMHVMITYPDETSEVEIVRMVRSEAVPSNGNKPETKTISQQVVFDARKEIDSVYTSEAVETYIVDLISATRFPERYNDQLKKWIHVGASPRGSIGLDKCSRAHAWLKGNDHVTPDDIRAVIHDVLRHRIMLSYEANADGVSADEVIAEIVKVVAVS